MADILFNSWFDYYYILILMHFSESFILKLGWNVDEILVLVYIRWSVMKSVRRWGWFQKLVWKFAKDKFGSENGNFAIIAKF